MTAKICKHCGIEKPLENFPSDSEYRDGHRSVCKECAKAKTAQWRAANLEHCRAYEPRPLLGCEACV